MSRGNGKMKRADLQIALERKNVTQKSMNEKIANLLDSGFMFEEDDYLILG